MPLEDITSMKEYYFFIESQPSQVILCCYSLYPSHAQVTLLQPTIIIICRLDTGLLACEDICISSK